MPTPRDPDCLETCVCNDGDKITVEFINPDPRVDDWIGIYKCLEDGNTVYNYHPDAWLWNCVDSICTGEPPSTGIVVFEDPIPSYNDFGPHQWPLERDQCYVALMNRNDGFSPPPYDMICEGFEFILE